MNRNEARLIIRGLIHKDLKVTHLTEESKQEIRTALDAIIAQVDMHDQAKCKLKGHVEPKEQSNG